MGFKMRYDYFGNTSLRVKNLLYNFETQLILFEELFSNANQSESQSFWLILDLT